MPARLTIESAGPGATIQDGGRHGYLRFGVTPAGPMDWVAFATANRALGQDADAAAIEIGLGGVALGTDRPVVLAFAGGGFRWTLGERVLPAAARVLLRPGETLRARPGPWGSFAYCAVPGGVDIPAIMGSRATHTRSAIGGLDGRMLRGGDVLAIGFESPNLDDGVIEAPWLRASEKPIHVILGPQDDHFTAAALETLRVGAFALTATADRMAYKFDGPRLAHAGAVDIVSDGVALGAIQVAGDGQPMVLMADRQPTGGYPKIAHVCRADIGRLAQMRPGDTCRFEVVDTVEARARLLRLEDEMETTDGHIRPLRGMPSAARLMQVNLVGGVTGADLPT